MIKKSLPHPTFRPLHLLLLCMAMAGPLATYGQSSEELVTQGRHAEELGLNARAADYYRKATEVDAESATPWRCLGLLYEHIGHTEQATYALQQAILRDSTDTVAYEHMAACLVDAIYDGTHSSTVPDTTALLAYIERAIELNPQSSSAHASMALLRNYEKKYMPAITWAKKAITLNDKYPRAYNTMGVILYNQGKDNEALSQFRKALAIDPTNDDAYYNLGVLHTQRGNHETALNYLKKGLKNNPNSVRLTYFMAVAYAQRGDNAKAIDCLKHITSTLDSLYTPAYNKLGSIYCSMGSYDQAVACHEKAMRINPNDAEPYKCLGKVYVDKGDYVKALRNYQRAVQCNDKDHETYLLMARLYAAQGNSSREAANYKRAAKLGNLDAQAWMVKQGKSW